MEDREPCPWRIVDDVGAAFLMGSIGGSIWHFFKGARSAPKGLGYRLNGAYTQIRLRAPALGGGFAIWGGIFSVFDCSLAHIRKTEDPYNAIASGALTGGLLAARAGTRAIARNAFFGGVILALIEGLQVVIQKQMTKFQMAQMRAQAEQMGMPIPGEAEEDRLEPPVKPPVAASVFADAGKGVDLDALTPSFGGGEPALR